MDDVGRAVVGAPAAMFGGDTLCCMSDCSEARATGVEVMVLVLVDAEVASTHAEVPAGPASDWHRSRGVECCATIDDAPVLTEALGTCSIAANSLVFVNSPSLRSLPTDAHEFRTAFFALNAQQNTANTNS